MNEDCMWAKKTARDSWVQIPQIASRTWKKAISQTAHLLAQSVWLQVSGPVAIGRLMPQPLQIAKQ
jgi:hypothetical protein